MICNKCKETEKCLKIDSEICPKCKVMVVAEKPTGFECISKTKFKGYQYNFLMQVIRKVQNELSLADSSIYATYAIKAPLTAWSAVRAKKCSEILFEEIKAVKPKVIIALGASVGRLFTGKSQDVPQLRKEPVFLRDLKCWIVPTYAPGSITYNLSILKDLENDIRKAFQLTQAKFPLGNKVEIGLVTSKSVKRNKKILEAMLKWKGKDISFDIETEGLDYCQHQVLALGFAWDERYSYTIPQNVLEDKGIQCLLDQFFQTENIFIGQNAKFDVGFLRFDAVFKKVVIPHARYDEDTMLMHYCLDERTGTHGLKKWAIDYFNAPDWESDIKRYLPNKESLYSLIPENILHKYLKFDVHYTLRGYRLFKELIKSEGTEMCYKNVLLPVSKAFTEIELEGVMLDVDALKQKMAEAKPEMARLSNELLEEATKVGWSPEKYVEVTGAKEVPKFFNVKSSKQMQWVAYDLCDMPKWNMGRDGYKKSCCKDAVEVYRYRHPFWKKLHEYKQVADLFGIYVKGMLEAVDGDGKIRPDFYLTGTVTGRISCHSPNLQNLPRKSFVKNMFIVPEDCVCVNVDYKTLEVVVASILCGDEVMQQPFLDGQDFHNLSTEGIFKDDLVNLRNWTSARETEKLIEYCNRPIMSEVREYIVNDYLLKSDFDGAMAQIFDYLRFLNKFVIFGVLYGRKARSLAEGELNCSVLEAQNYIDQFFIKFPKFAIWAKNQQEMAVTQGYVQTAFGFKRRWSSISQDEIYRIENQSINTPIQGTAAQITLMALTKCHEAFKTNKYGRVLFTVHDSIVFEVKKAYLNASLDLIHNIMAKMPKELNTKLPLVAEIEIGKNYGEHILVKRSPSGIWVNAKDKDKEQFENLMLKYLTNY